MTIIQPNKINRFGSFFILIFVLLLVGGGIFIFEYNAFANVRHEKIKLKKDIIELQATNADFKNELYTAIDPSNLEMLAQNYNLTLEKKPSYLNN